LYQDKDPGLKIMALILTFLGKGGVGKTTLAIAAAKRYASQNRRVLYISQDASPALDLVWGEDTPQIDRVVIQTALLLEKAWEDLKTLEAQYLRTPFFKNVYGQELGVVPGMESVLLLNEIRRYEPQYDVIVMDGWGNPETLRMLGLPEVVSWYARRFRQVFGDSDLGRTIGPFLPPIAAAVLNVSAMLDNFSQPNQIVDDLLAQGRATIADPRRVAAYLVTTSDPTAIATAKYLWGSAQQIGLTVGGVLLNQASNINDFAPLSVSSIPTKVGDDWQPLLNALPDFAQAGTAPPPIKIDVANKQVVLFLPGFDKTQVKLTQYGPEITIEAGGQRRNIFLPPELTGQPVSGAKFQEGYLIISFGSKS
jgi:anion-transporting  ArsA/GET3 family ATPase